MSLPRKISDYTVLPLTLPGSDKIAEATHYLYVRQHAPSTPTPEAARSLFAVNIPVDATEAHLRSLFSEIGGGRVESVIFDRDNKRAPQALAVELHDASKKRKRGVATEGVSAPPPPLTTWDRPLRKSGSHAVVVFVDRSSADMALKAAAAVQKEGKTPPVWSDALAPREPALGLPREWPTIYIHFIGGLSVLIAGLVVGFRVSCAPAIDVPGQGGATAVGGRVHAKFCGAGGGEPARAVKAATGAR